MCSGRLWKFREKEHCEMCGNAVIQRRYVRYAWAIPGHDCGVGQIHLCCTCPVCGNQWGEETYEMWKARTGGES